MDVDTKQEKRRHQYFVFGWSLHIVAGTLATIATFLDFNWSSPAKPNFGSPFVPNWQEMQAVTAVL